MTELRKCVLCHTEDQSRLASYCNSNLFAFWSLNLVTKTVIICLTPVLLIRLGRCSSFHLPWNTPIGGRNRNITEQNTNSKIFVTSILKQPTAEDEWQDMSGVNVCFIRVYRLIGKCTKVTLVASTQYTSVIDVSVSPLRYSVLSSPSCEESRYSPTWLTRLGKEELTWWRGLLALRIYSACHT